MTILTSSRNKKLPIEWGKHLKNEEERREFLLAVQHDTLVLGRLSEILQEKLAGLEGREVSAAEYDNPAWAYKQAHINGMKAGLTQVLKMLP